ncbi:hypothetical protein [Flavobacterium sp.]|uniref:hypothetical protein n=1 Tax=Flavobacterium sp. TaxID=239 RepID=UPI0038FD3120
MGSLKFFDLNDIVEKYQTSIFVETGLGWGHGVQFARTFNFEKLYSIELVKEVIDQYRKTYPPDSKIQILQGDSLTGLNHILPDIKENICFWLDAHFPASDVFGIPFDSCEDENLRLPLWEELNLIKKLRPNNKDVFLMDDAMIFSETEVFPDNHCKLSAAIQPKLHINYLDKIKNFFNETHNSELFYKESGYIIFTPKP